MRMAGQLPYPRPWHIQPSGEMAKAGEVGRMTPSVLELSACSGCWEEMVRLLATAGN